MLLLTRGIWPDVLIDFGHEIYVFWRISEGQVLYRDIAHLKGPLSAYLNGTVFRIFGASLTTLVLTNLALVAALGAMLHALFERIAGRAAAALAGLTLVLVFAFSQLEAIGSYNFLAPYSHEVTHGVTLCVAAVFLLGQYLWSGRIAWLLGSGAALGLAFLTDGHVFLAGAGAVGAGVVATSWIERPRRARLASLAASFLGGLLAPPLAAFALLALAMPARDALLGAIGSLRYMARGEIVFERLYRWQMGTLDPAASLRSIGIVSLVYLALFVPPIALGALLRNRTRATTVASGALIAIVLGSLLLPGRRVVWGHAFRPLSLIVSLMVVAFTVQLLRARRDRRDAAPAILRLVLALLSLALMAKIALNVRVMDYGFALALPGTLLCVAALSSWIPDLLRARGWNPSFFRALSLGAWCAAMLAIVGTTGRFASLKRVGVGEGRDAFLADARGSAVVKALELLAQSSRPGETFAVMPEGAMLNYLARVPNPTPYPVLSPPEVALYGEDRMLAAFRGARPDRIVLVHADSSIHGVRFFGQDYGTKLFSWVMENYRSVAVIGARPFTSERFGIQILERNDRTAASGE